MAPSRRLLLREGRFALIAPIAAFLAYLPVVVVPYAYADDYSLLGWRQGFTGDFFKTATSFGRPLHALVLRAAFSLAPTIDALRFVRLVALLGVMLLAVFLYYALRSAEVDRWLAVAVCVTLVSLASIQVYVSWAAVFEAPYVAIVAGLAWIRLRSGFGLTRRAELVRGAEAAAILLLALLTYQPAAMFFWVFAAVDVLRAGQPLGRAARNLGAGIAVAAVAMFCAYAAVRIGTHFYGGPLSGRTNLVDDPVGKVRWFLHEPIVNGFGMFDLVSTTTVAVALAIVAAGGIVLLHADAGRSAFGFLGLAAILVPLSYLPNLAVAEDFASYRSIGALAALLTIYAWLGLLGVWRSPRARLVVLPVAALVSFAALALAVVPLWRPEKHVTLHTLSNWPELAAFAVLFVVVAAVGVWRRPAARLVGAVALIAFAAAGVAIAARNVTTLVVEPQNAELQMLRSALDSPRRPEPKRIVFVKPNGALGAAPLVRYDEFGTPSTSYAWVPYSAALLVLRERVHARPPVAVYAWDQAPAASGSPSEAFVDMRKLRERRVGWTLWTLDGAPPARSARHAASAR